MTIENIDLYNPQKEFSYNGTKYCSVNANEFDYWNVTNKCEHCDLKVGNRKLCYNNNCNCGSCGGIVFKKVKPKHPKITNSTDLETKVIELEALVTSLKSEIQVLREQNKGLQMHLATVSRVFEEYKVKCATMEAKYKDIYLKINKAIKGVFYND